MDGEVKIGDEQIGRIRKAAVILTVCTRPSGQERVQAIWLPPRLCHHHLANYFRMYHKLAGMTGTAETEAGGSGTHLKLDVIGHSTTNMPISCDMEDRYVYRTKH